MSFNKEAGSNHSVKPTRSGLRPPRAAYLKRVCRAWHESRRVKVLAPGISRAEG